MAVETRLIVSLRGEHPDHVLAFIYRLIGGDIIYPPAALSVDVQHYGQRACFIEAQQLIEPLLSLHHCAQRHPGLNDAAARSIVASQLTTLSECRRMRLN